MIEAAKGSNVAVGAQNIHFAEEGAYTGETSIGQLKAVGGTHTLIGHSERRQYFGETDEIVNKKLHTALKHGIVPIVCIGEVLAEREAGKTEDVLKTQVTGAFAGITAGGGRANRDRLRARVGHRHRQDRHAGDGRRSAQDHPR